MALFGIVSILVRYTTAARTLTAHGSFDLFQVIPAPSPDLWLLSQGPSVSAEAPIAVMWKKTDQLMMTEPTCATTEIH